MFNYSSSLIFSRVSHNLTLFCSLWNKNTDLFLLLQLFLIVSWCVFFRHKDIQQCERLVKDVQETFDKCEQELNNRGLAFFHIFPNCSVWCGKAFFLLKILIKRQLHIYLFFKFQNVFACHYFFVYNISRMTATIEQEYWILSFTIISQ